MKASETSFRNLLEGSKQFKVPLFQRPYSWEKENWETLWDDLMTLYDENMEGYHFLGPIVTLAEPGTPDGISPYLLIDGQQRLTTLTLLLVALRDILKRQGPEFAEELHELYLINKFKKGNDLYKVLPTQADRNFYQQIVQEKEVEKRSRIYEAYSFFLRKLEKGETGHVNTPLNLSRLKTVVLERMTLVSITLNDDDNPYLIFESLNYKGAPLTQADLIRNYFFLQIPKEDHDQVYADFWLPLQEDFKSVARGRYLDELTLAFWQYLRKDGVSLKQNQIYQVFKQSFENKGLNALQELKQVIEFADYYRRVHFPETEEEAKLARWFKRFRRLDFTTCYPLVLNLYSDYKNKRILLMEFEQALRFIESYFVRRLLCGMPSNALDKVFNTLYRETRERRTSDLVGALRETLLSLQRTQIWPDDDSLKRSIVEERLYTDRRNDRVKLILESLAENLSKEQVKTDNFTVEHIMPQTLTDEWRAMLGANANEQHERWLHTLGNLTLTAYNSELSNKPFADKLTYLAEKSSFALNHYFRSVNAWNASEIQRRGQYLSEIAIQVWPR
ncbi:DUF262 domain-containing protein [Leptolyngbya boryana CZ1]|uniref:DUF262 domain-containing protein n=1 Tax=Leptolyngbya boryana CZ1 TaxID=3060204 RepID=A0AA96WRV9_LEPBY|nr:MULTISPECIES: DUF262 domain-containing protein [Leptolyngbya]MBD1857845.1 DUF262 domain-containing protein [Leptolyngbya sp. FACHB-1624]WNZ44646.1 DUF262 domain-containing protein [Leptolyngbya boryana CZ1]